MLIEIIILLLAIPTGFLIAALTKDELIQGRKWFKILILASILGVFGFWIYGFPYISWTCGFILIVSLISLIKSEDKILKKRKL